MSIIYLSSSHEEEPDRELDQKIIEQGNEIDLENDRMQESRLAEMRERAVYDQRRRR